MDIAEIRIYEPMPACTLPAHQISDIASSLCDVAHIIQHVRDYVVHEAKIEEKDLDTLSGMLRGSLALMRDMGDYLAAIEKLSKAWHNPLASAAKRQAA